MRSIIFCLSLFCILACGNRNSYTIEGRYNSAADGTMLYLTAFDDILAVIDSTEVEDGRFVFEGVCDTLSVCYISSSQVIDGGFVVLEPGEISFGMGNGTACSGTPLNNAVARFLHERDRLADVRTMVSPAMMDKMNLEKHMTDSLRSVAALAAFSVHSGLTMTAEYFGSQQVCFICQLLEKCHWDERRFGSSECFGNQEATTRKTFGLWQSERQ